jgi:hypothetical protein
MSDLSVPQRLLNGVGNWPDSDKFMDDFDFLTALLAGSFLINGGEELWGTTSFSSPADATPLNTGWISHRSGTTPPTFTIARESTTKDTGTYSKKFNITVAGSADYIIGDHQAANNVNLIAGYTVVFGRRVYASTANKVRLRIYDGTTTTYGAYHTGGGSFESLYVKALISAAATSVTVYIDIVGDFTGAVYADGAFCYIVPASISNEAAGLLLYQSARELAGLYLSQAGGTMTGDIAMGGFKVTGLGAATANGDAVRYEQVFPGPSGTFFGVGKNRVINGEMRIDQANAGAATAGIAASGVYGTDMFRGQGTASAGVFTLTRSTSTPATGATHFLRVTCTTADASIAAGDTYILRHFIEGNNVRDFLIGTANAVPITLSFWVRSSLTGTYCVAFGNNAQDRNYIVEYTINVANTWEKKTVTLTCDTTGTWVTDTNVGLQLTWTMAAGSTFQGTANTWQAGNLYATSNQVNFMSSNSSRTWDLTLVQVEIGATATSYEYRPFQVEVMLCQRYYEKSSDLEVAPLTISSIGSYRPTVRATSTSATEDSCETFQVIKRVAPTMTGWNADAGTTNVWAAKDSSGGNITVTPAFGRVNTHSFGSGFTGGSGLTVGQAMLIYGGHWAADARF